MTVAPTVQHGYAIVMSQPMETTTDPLSPLKLTPGRRVKVLVAGLVLPRTALVTDRKDRFGWCMLHVDGPPGDMLIGTDLRCEDYVVMEYLDSTPNTVGGAV